MEAEQSLILVVLSELIDSDIKKSTGGKKHIVDKKEKCKWMF